MQKTDVFYYIQNTLMKLILKALQNKNNNRYHYDISKLGKQLHN